MAPIRWLKVLRNGDVGENQTLPQSEKRNKGIVESILIECAMVAESRPILLIIIQREIGGGIKSPRRHSCLC